MLLLMLLALIAAPAAALDCTPTLHGFPAEYVVSNATETACTYRRPDGRNVTIAFNAPGDPTTTLASTSDDGFLWGQSATYLTAQSTGTVAQPSQVIGYIGQLQDSTGGFYYYVERVFFSFDLSSIPAGATVSSATLSLTTDVVGAYSVGSNPWNAILREFSWVTPLSANIGPDFSNCMNASGINDLVWASSAQMSYSTTIPVSLTDFAWFKFGTGAVPTSYCMFSTRDQAQIAPANATQERVDICMSEHGTNPPTLQIIWSSGPTPTPTSPPTLTPTNTAVVTPTARTTFTPNSCRYVP